MIRRSLTLGTVVLALSPAWTQAANDTRHALECPAQAPSDWGAKRGQLVGVQVLSAKRGEVIDEAAPPDLVPDQEATRSGVLHQIWQMNAEGPDWQFFVWCHYGGTNRILKLSAPNVKQCERTLPAAHPDRPPQQLVCD